MGLGVPPGWSSPVGPYEGQDKSTAANVCQLCENAASDGHHELVAEVLTMRQSLRAIRNHWSEFGPENGFEETLERACAPIDINKGVGSTWVGLPKSPAQKID